MARRSKYKIGNFKYPSQDKIHNRISTLCRSIACTLSERRECSEEDEKNWKKFFPNEICAYCGGVATHLDHLYALVENQTPTGYGTEPANLVPCCASCNSKKGNKNWKEYMKSDKCPHIEGNSSNKKIEINKRIKRIEKFQKAMPAKQIKLTNEITNKLKQIQDDLKKQLEKTEDEISLVEQQISQLKS